MRSFVLGLVSLIALAVAAAVARAAPERKPAGVAVEAGFRKTLVAETLPATLPRSRGTTSVFASVTVTAEVGEDQ